MFLPPVGVFSCGFGEFVWPFCHHCSTAGPEVSAVPFPNLHVEDVILSSSSEESADADDEEESVSESWTIADISRTLRGVEGGECGDLSCFGELVDFKSPPEASDNSTSETFSLFLLSFLKSNN